MNDGVLGVGLTFAGEGSGHAVHDAAGDISDRLICGDEDGEEQG
jgi:hypothetical protein